MKRTLLGLTVAGLALSANAVTVYEQDGTKFNANINAESQVTKLDGERANLSKAQGNTQFTVTHDLGNGLSAVAGLKFRLNRGVDVDVDIDDPASAKYSNKSAEVKQAYVGFGFENIGTLTLGKQSNALDGVAIENGSVFDGFAVSGEIGDSLDDHADADKVILFKSADFNGLSFAASYEFGNADASIKSGKTYTVSALYATDFNDSVSFKFNAAYQQKTDGPSFDTAGLVSDLAYKKWIVAGAVEFDKFLELSVNYGERRITGQDKVKFGLVGVKAQVTPDIALYADYGKTKDYATNKRINKFMLGTEYAFNKNVKVYLEAGRSKVDSEKAATGVGTGLKVVW